MNRLEWLRWRHQGLGGSDAPIVMGVSPWKTPLQLYEERIQLEPTEHAPNFVTERGDRYEPKIRSLYSLMCGVNFQPALLESKDFPFMRVSLDGRSPDGTAIAEIKTVGVEDHELAKAGKIPPKYWPQLQHELFVSGAKSCFYLSYYDPLWDEKNVISENMAIVRVLPDQQYISELIITEHKFWDCVQTRKPPLPCDRDYKKIKGMAKHANKFKRLKLQIEKLSGECEEVREVLLARAKEENHPRLMYPGLKLQQISKIGNVDYKKVPELKGVDLDQYRGNGSLYWKIDVV